MKLQDAETMARAMIAWHLEGWAFKWDNASRRFGMCRHSKRLVQLSRKIVALNEEGKVRETVLHEIAHALVGRGHGHDRVWAQMCRNIGLADTSRCCSADTVIPALRWRATCPGCGVVASRARAPKRNVACATCCRRHNFGRYSAAYQLTFIS